jgi:translin
VERLDDIIERVGAYFEMKNKARDQALARSRELIRYCANTIRAAHRGDYDEAAQLLSTAREAAQQMVSDLADHPDLYYTGYTQDALKEFAEASITLALITDRPLPTPEELDVLPATYLNGLGEAMGELRRYVLDVMRHGQVERCERMLQAMEDVYSVLVTIDYPDTLTGGLRRTTDMVRGVLERTRGDLTVAARQDVLQRALYDLERKLEAHPELPLPAEPQTEGSDD